jgi:glycosyltransferase involved in cell wall biosynthesis
MATGAHALHRSDDPLAAAESPVHSHGPAGRKIPQRQGLVLVVAPQPFYEDRGTPIATRLLLQALTELGYRAELLTYPVGTTPEIEGVRYTRLSNPLGFRTVPVSFSLKKLFLDGLLALRLPFMARRGRYIYVHAIEEAAFLAVMLRGRHRAPVVYDMASSLPEQLALKPLFRARPLQAIFRGMERRLLQNVDCVIASAGLGQFVTDTAAETPTFEWRFPADNMPVTPEALARLRRDLDLPSGARVVCYTGTFAAYQGIPQLMAAIPQVVARHPDAYFVLVGAQSEEEVRSSLAALPEPLRANTRILPRQPRSEIAGYMALADVLVSPRAVGDNIPLKVFEFLAMAKPVVATRIPAHEAILDDTLALMVAPSAAGIAAGISAVLSDSELARRLAASARAYADEHLSWAGFVRLIDDLGQAAIRRQASRSQSS